MLYFCHVCYTFEVCICFFSVFVIPVGVFAVPQLERCCQGGKISFCGGQNFWVCLLFSEVSVDLKKKKRSSHEIGLIFSKFSADFKKKGHLAKLFRLFPSFLLLSKQKVAFSPQKGTLGGHAGNFRGVKFFFRGRRPLLPPPLVAALSLCHLCCSFLCFYNFVFINS